nr:VOC family protein [Methylobacterium sp. Leaf89]
MRPSPWPPSGPTRGNAVISEKSVKVSAPICTNLRSTCNAEEAIRHDVSRLPDSRPDHLPRARGPWPGGTPGDVIPIRFTLGGQSFQALNGDVAADDGTAASIRVAFVDRAASNGSGGGAGRRAVPISRGAGCATAGVCPGRSFRRSRLGRSGLHRHAVPGEARRRRPPARGRRNGLKPGAPQK